MKRRPLKLTDQLRQAINACGRTRYRISQDTGIAEAVLSKFVNGKAGMALDTLDTLGQYLGLRLVAEDSDLKPINADTLQQRKGR